MQKALLVKPMEKLPSVLIPRGIYKNARPPKLHYGWALNDPNRLLDIARKMNIPPRDRGEQTTATKEDDGEDREVKKLNAEEEVRKPCVSMTDIWMRRDALKAVAKELELRGRPYLVEVFSPGEGRVQMIALIENYELRDGFVSRSDIQKLREYFDFEGGPIWYLDTYFWTSNSERFWNCKLFVTSFFTFVLMPFHNWSLNVSLFIADKFRNRSGPPNCIFKCSTNCIFIQHCL